MTLNCSIQSSLGSWVIDPHGWLPGLSLSFNSPKQYHPTSGLMQILHFDWLHYQGTISNSHRVAKFAGFSFVFFPHSNKCFFNLHLLTLLLPFLSDQLGDTKTIRPFIKSILKITGYPCNLIDSQVCDLFTNRTIFLL